jgi:ketosteroid isomerase-like protein
MSEENVEIVRAVLSAFASGDREAALAQVDPEVVVDATRRTLNPATYVGLEGVRDMLTELDDTWESMEIEQRELLDAGDRVVVMGRLLGKGKASGIEVERSFNGQVWTVRNGRIVRLEFGFTDRESTLAAAGLSE